MSCTGDQDALDCQECGAVSSIPLDVCQVCYAEVAEHGPGLGIPNGLFWDLSLGEVLFEAESPACG
jgi:hypothetical protein